LTNLIELVWLCG